MKVGDWITAQNYKGQLEILSIGADYVYCSDYNGEKYDGVEIKIDDILTCGERRIKESFNKFGRF